MKYCPQCKKVLPLDRFVSSNRSKDGYTYLCIKDMEKARQYTLRWYHKNYRKNFDQDRLRRLKRKKKYRLKYPEKEKAHYALHAAVYKGVIKKQPCEVCGNQKVQGHHPDYSKPLEVKWLCVNHHMMEHRIKA